MPFQVSKIEMGEALAAANPVVKRNNRYLYSFTIETQQQTEISADAARENKDYRADGGVNHSSIHDDLPN